MTLSTVRRPFVTQKGAWILMAGTVLGASAGVWFWWALQLSWWFGIPLVMGVIGLVRVWLGWQLAPADIPRRVSAGPFVVASWICLTSPMIVTAVFFLVAPKTLPPPGERAAAAIRASQFIYPQAIAVLFGLVSLWGVRRWQPLGVIVRSGLGIGIACWTAAIFATVAVGINLWH